ncbi:hypothetical protein ACHHYP_12021 [Achlya hypogyna]|uniref:Rab-GAP TBC domain-containing protein n=1 Tax=Achlya hypogyna TaxID=1202772 RepID=A0A1V9YHS7_ACHHY|nr:hypothetical protein ACHHYP_12021 [Achlya hypogyna]
MTSGSTAVTPPSYLQDLRQRADTVLASHRSWPSSGRGEPVVVHFGPGFLGLGFGLSTHATYAVKIQDLPSLSDGSLGAASLYNAAMVDAALRLVPGLLLTHINDRDMANTAYVAVLDHIQAVGRPVKLRFAVPKPILPAAKEPGALVAPTWTADSVAFRVFHAVQAGHFLVLLELWPQVDLAWRYPTDGRSLLHFAARYKNEAAIQWILQQQQGPALARVRNGQGRLPLHDAISGGHAGICDLVASAALHSFSPSRQVYAQHHSAVTAGDYRGVLCVHLAAGNGHLHLLHWLAAHEATLASTSTDGKTALHYAAAQGHVEVVEHLAALIDVAAVDIHQCNCLHYAALHSHLELAQWLVFQTGVPVAQYNARRLRPSDMVPGANAELKQFLALVSAEPLPPQDFQAVTTATTATLSWTPTALPLEFRCTSVETFELDFGRAYIGSWEPFHIRLDAAATTCVVPGLLPNTEYSFRLRAWNANGPSAFTKVTARTLPPAPSTPRVLRIVGVEARYLPLSDATARFFVTLSPATGFSVRTDLGRLHPAFHLNVDAYRHPQWPMALPLVVSENGDEAAPTAAAPPTTVVVAVYRATSVGATLVGRATVAVYNAPFTWTQLEGDAVDGAVVLVQTDAEPPTEATDRYGYTVPLAHARAIAHASALAACIEELRRQRWAASCPSPNVRTGHRAWLAVASPAPESLAWQGVPQDLRRHVYFVASGAAALQAAVADGYYTSLVHANAADPSAVPSFALIAADVVRTFADQAVMGPLRGRLEKLLLAFVAHAPAVGYCQSMNYIGARLLALYDADEERAFWVLVALCAGKFPRYYDAQLAGLHTDGAVLERLLAARLPRLSQHCTALGTPLPLIAAQWLLPLFCQNFPAETTFRLLDVVVLHSSTTVVFALVLAHLRLAAPRLLETAEYIDLTVQLRQIEAGLYDCDHLLETAAKEHFSLGTDVDVLRAADVRRSSS